MTTMKFALTSLVSLAIGLGAVQIVQAERPVAAVQKKFHTFLLQHCQDCHGGEEAEAGFRIDNLPLELSDNATAARWQKVLGALNSGEMPPAGEPALDKGEKADFLDHLAHVMVDARRHFADRKGVITMRRLNRREYRNTLRELLGVEINVSDLLSDTGSGAFDTDGSNLYISSTQFQQYLALGREALDEAFEWEAAAGVERKLRFETEAITEKVAEHIEYQLDAQQRAKRWMEQVDQAVERPENAAIVEEIRAGPLGKHRHIFYRNWKKFPSVAAPETFGFQTGENNADKAITASSPFHLPYHRYYLEQPEIETGAYLAAPNEHPSVLDNATINLLVPFSWPVGEYVVRFRAAATEHATPERSYLEFGINPRSQQAISAHEITGTIESPQIVEIPLTMTRANKLRANRSLYLREKGTRDDWVQATRIARQGREANDGIGRTFALWIDWIEIERVPRTGQSKAPGIVAISQLPLDDKSAAPALDEVRTALRQFAAAAFRGESPSPDYIDQLVQIYEEQRQAGAKYSDALKETLAIVLASPMFLYHAEPQEGDQTRRLSERELANRLSYFLWGAPADAQLIKLADQGQLRKPDVLAAQATRLLDDPRSIDFVNSFTYQWLGLERLDFFQVNQAHHPRFDNSTRQAAKAEIYETLRLLLREDRPLSDLLNSDYVVVNGLLAQYYGIEDVHGDHFRPVALPEGSPRGGLLGMAAVHLMGGNGDTTSPVERGAWVLRKLLHDPPPPAPANIPQLARLAGKPLTTRQRLSAHQEEPQCASCHRKIDPIGFGLENFDAVGVWRTEDSYQVVDDNGKPTSEPRLTWKIDASGALHDGPAFENYFELRDLISSHKDDFARGFSEALVQYALGRPAGFSDEPLLEELVRTGRESDYAIRTYVQTLIQSKEFQSK
ncbi:MAG: DUF1592 domain-containing protein [Blastopirellula sp. JB062]